MLYYHISTGTILENTKFLGTGYSGAGKTFAEGRNNAVMCPIKNVGPIPPGLYKIIKPAYWDPKLGPCVMQLIPQEGTITYNRDAFRIHGNNARNDASHGCIILGPTIREYIEHSLEEYLSVTEH